MLRFAGIFWGLLFVGSLTGQSSYFLSDTSHLILEDTFHIQEVEIVSPVTQKLQVGSKTETFTAMQKQNVIVGSLTNLVSKYAPVYVRSDAGGLATFRFRGTSSTHTSVFVGGININSLTLGSSNPNNVPIFLFDNIGLNYGAASASTGSGSIGGSIRLGLNNNWTEGFKGDFLASTGSFGEYKAGAKLFYGNGKWEAVTRISHYQKENDFPYSNVAYYDRELQQYRRDTLKNSAISNQHILQQINYRFDKNKNITSFFWYSEKMHEAQPNMAQNNSSTVRPIEDRDFKSWISYQQSLNTLKLKIEGGYISDKSIDNKDEINTIGTHRVLSNVGLKGKHKQLDFEANLSYKYIWPKVYAYDDNITEEQFDIHGALLYRVSSRLFASLNLRQQYVTKFDAPFTPSLGLDYLFRIREFSSLKLLGNIQRSYKIPTFNDRYWGQIGYQGNKDINPEDGMNYELGVKYIVCKDNFKLTTNVNAYYMDVDNWILWVQRAEGWKAENILRVISKGVEFHADADIKIQDFKISSGLNYAYNSAIRKESTQSTDKLDRQIEYNPQHLGNAFINMAYKKYNLSFDAAYTGKRHYDQTEKYLEAYTLCNISAFRDIEMKSNNLTLGIHVNNIFGEEYQNQYQYAMPEVNYQFTINYKF